ncbi:MAG: rhomboid family intramembrane serine protease, partial [Pseudobdellovibrio sp.]|nr:rhomboid family intramembrane serine protease [Pseudobdellovibrio sp.]
MSSFSMAPVTSVVKKLLIINVVIWVVVQIILDRAFGFHQWRYLILTPELVIEKFYVWQLFTYQF